MHEIRTFLEIAARLLSCPYRTELTFESEGSVTPHRRHSWSAFITFDWLKVDAHYCNGQLPKSEDLGEEYVADIGWGDQGPIPYVKVAHIVIPRFFVEEYVIPPKKPVRGARANVTVWQHEQHIDALSEALRQAGIEHGLTEYALEAKRY